MSSSPLKPLQTSTPGVPLTLVGGALMGVANIIPGVSGGTMILALGLYEEFIESVAAVTRLRRTLRPYLFLAILATAALMAILLLSSVIEYLLTEHHVPTFALFIGLALGGVPLIWREMRPARTSGWIAAAAGFGLMIVVSVALNDLNVPQNFVVYFVAGVLASAAMVLPGISGSHLLLVLGLYSPVIAAVSDFKDGLRAFDLGAMMPPAVSVGIPLAAGIVVGIGGLSNLLKWTLARYHQATMGFLLGLLVGSAFPMNPFREPGHKDLFTTAAPITGANLAIVAGAVVAGLIITVLIGKLNRGQAAAH
jgi:putative membrane protein